jgi:hypothetical protein
MANSIKVKIGKKGKPVIIKPVKIVKGKYIQE